LSAYFTKEALEAKNTEIFINPNGINVDIRKYCKENENWFT